MHNTYQPETDQGRQVRNLLDMCDDADTILTGGHGERAPCRHHGELATCMVIYADALGKASKKIDDMAKSLGDHRVDIALLKQEVRREARRWGAISAIGVSVASTVIANAIIYWVIASQK